VIEQAKRLGQRLVAYLRPCLHRPSRGDLRRALFAAPLWLLLALFLYILLLIPFTPAISDIRKARLEQPAQVLSADGKELAVFKRANREWVPLSDIAPPVIAALIATEDHRFYEHHGLDWRRTVGAALNTFAGERQGGSTITQQLARNLYPEEIGRAPTLNRKLKEAITALKIEAVYSKQEILETYLNTVPFLYNAYGIEMAARTYFDSSAKSLDVLQSATLVGMLKGNSYYNPVLNPERAVERRNTVLAQMVKRQELTAERFERLKKAPLRLDFERQNEPLGPAPHFTQQLRKWLINWADKNDYNIYADGLIVHSTIDYRLQSMANQAVARQGRQLQGLADAAWGPRSGWNAGKEPLRSIIRETADYRAARDGGLDDGQALKKLQANAAFMAALRQQKTTIQAGFVAIDPRNGQIKAWVGSRDYSQDAYDHVHQARRQPGSTFKPFVYGAAFLQGAKPDDTLIDQAVEIPLKGGEIWRPSDHGAPSGQPMSLRDALIYSKNTVTAQLMQTVGPARVIKLARAMGVRQSKLTPVPSLALGSSPVTLEEMVAAYATIANAGNYLEPVMVTRIEDRNGRVLEEFSSAEPEAALPPSIDYSLLDVLRGVVDRGTGSAIRSRFGIHADVAGKTGTTQDNTDGWFILMHPQLVAGAWVGFNDNRITLRSDYWGQGAHSALPLVGDFFQQALHNHLLAPRVRFAEPPQHNLLNELLAWGRQWWQRLFGSAPPAPPAAPRPAHREAPLPAPTPEAPAVEESAPPPPNPAAPLPPEPAPAAATGNEAGGPLAEAPASGASGSTATNGAAARAPASGEKNAPAGMPTGALQPLPQR
jgi:penicillin-binding protein 1A